MNNLLASLQPVFNAIIQAGGHPLIVGGAVRDTVLGFPPKDIDIEVYRLPVEQLAAAIAPFGRLDTVGRSFGVLKLRLPNGRELDLALPQRRVQGLPPQPDPHMAPREAAARRDFTWNAMAITSDGQLIDYFGGQHDLQAGIIRHTSDAFGEDPLRVLRAMQFAARFDMRLAPETAIVCRGLLLEAGAIAPERIWVEWQKWALKGYRPSAGLRVLEETGWHTLYPELVALIGCPQQPEWHPEGDVWVHTGHVCDAAALVATREGLDDEVRATLVFSALCHDLGKPATTAVAGDGRIRSPGHAAVGVEPAHSLMKRINAPRRLAELVLPLVREHMSLLHAAPTERSVRRLAVRLEPATIALWRMLVEADYSGRPPIPPGDPGAPVVALAMRIGAASGRPAPLVTGDHLLALGFRQGPQLGEILRRTYTAQIDGVFATTEDGVTWVRELIQE